MEVERTIDLGNGHKIEFGQATWDKNSISIRNRYPTSTGGFNPRSSSELPIGDVRFMAVESIKNDYLTDYDIKLISSACKKKIKSKQNNFLKWFIKNLEALGLIILLTSFGWQLFESDLTSLSQDVDLYQTNQKLDAIWSVISADYYQKHPNEYNSYKTVNIDAYDKNWKLWGDMLKEKDYLNNQLKTTMYIRVVLYLIGSIMLIYPKLKNNNS